MPRFSIEGPDVAPAEVEADNWMSALAEALTIVGVRPDEAAGVECDVMGDGDIQVLTPRGAFVLHEVIDTIARIRIESRPVEAQPRRLAGLAYDMPGGPSPLDAPDPTTSPSYRVRNETSEAILREIDARLAKLEEVPPGSLPGAALDLLMEFIPAESGAVLVVEPSTRELRFVAARGPRAVGLVGRTIPPGRGIAGLAVRAGVALTVREAEKDPRHYGEVDARTGYRTEAILVVPLRAPSGPVGCVELLNPFAGSEFATWHQSATLMVAARVAPRLAPA